MLSRPELGTREHIKLWLAGKDPNEKYIWSSSRDCACGCYARENLGVDYLWQARDDCPAALKELNHIAQRASGYVADDRGICHRGDGTFGRLYTDVCGLGW